MKPEILLSTIIEFLGDEVKGFFGCPEGIIIKHLKAPNDVDEYTLDWVNPARTDKQFIAEQSKAKALLISTDIEYSAELQEQSKALIVVDNPKLAIAKVGNVFFVANKKNGIHGSVVINAAAKLGNNLFIGENSIIGDCIIGDKVIIYQNVVINDGVIIGNNVVIKPGAILGFEGFGYERTKNGELIKFPQLGRLIIEDNVEIGANTCIDKGSLSDTIIGYGTKINNLCHIAHNVIIGKNVIITAHVNISGSTIIEDNVWIAPNSSLIGHQSIGENATIGMGAVVIKDVPARETWVGNPAKKLNK